MAHDHHHMMAADADDAGKLISSDSNTHAMHVMMDDGMNMHMNGSSGDMVMMMQMYFTQSLNSTVLFKHWTTSNSKEMLGACFAWFFISIFYEFLKVLRERLLLRRPNQCFGCLCNVKRGGKCDVVQKGATSTESRSDDLSNGSYGSVGSPLRKPSTTSSKASSNRLLSVVLHLIQTLLHVMQITIGYLMMLVVMTYNVWLFIAVVAGCGTGYLCFGWIRSLRDTVTEDLNEQCH